MAILVVGGAGFIGHHLTNLLIGRGHNTVTMDYINENSIPEALNSKTVLIKSDCSDTKTLTNILNKYDVSTVIDLTTEWQYHQDNIDTPKNKKFTENISGFLKTIHTIYNYWDSLSLDKKQRFVYLKTFSLDILGSDTDNGILIDPISMHGAAEAFKFHTINSWYRTYNFPAIITIASDTYGPNQLNSFLPNIIINALSEKVINVSGNGKQIKNWLYVTDHCNAIYLAITRGKIGLKYCISPNKTIYTIDIINIVCEIMNELSPRKNGQSYNDLIKFAPYDKTQQLQKICYSTKLESELGFTANFELRDGIKETIKWILDKKKLLHSN